MAGILFIISAPSGSGKSTLVGQLRSLVAGLEFSVSYTTRALRGSEENGREYYFTNRPTFERMIANDEFLEWAEVFGKDYYGTARTALSHAHAGGKDLLLDIDVQGAAQVMEKLPEAVSIFVVPPSPEVLERRLRNRSEAEHGTTEEEIERRLQQARSELKRGQNGFTAFDTCELNSSGGNTSSTIHSCRAFAVGLVDCLTRKLKPVSVTVVTD